MTTRKLIMWLVAAWTIGLVTGSVWDHAADNHDTYSLEVDYTPEPDCPTEDSCVADYDGTDHRWHITEVTP